MGPGRKLGKGCWTCRLRRKRCDSVRPVCGSCESLQITCHSGEARPPWMDGAAKQQHITETIRESIKQNALLRRERRRLIHEDQGIIIATATDHTFYTDAASGLDSRATSRSRDVVVDDALRADSIATSALATNLVGSTAFRSSSDLYDEPQSLRTSFSPIYGPVVPMPVQLCSVMIYLDYVFPFCFPFYQPSLMQTGRQWLLGLLGQNEVSFHIAGSLSTYFYSLVPQDDGDDMPDQCKALVRGRLLEQMDMAVKSIQTTISAINCQGTQSPLLSRARVMEEIAQLLIVEVTVRRNVEWTIHLTPALALFDEIFQSHGMDHRVPNLAVLMGALPSPFPAATPHEKPLPHSADQSALVFFVSLLLFIDIVASTSLRNPPVLQHYHHSLLSSHGGAKCHVRLEDVVGCQNWALVAIGSISALSAWKRNARLSGTFSVVNLVNHAAPIAQALEDGLASLDVHAARRVPEKTSTNRLKAYYSRHDRTIDTSSIANITRIWAYAAKIYLSVSLSGWQTNSSDTQSSVTKILTLLQTIKSPAQLRSLSWPIAVAGCSAQPSKEPDFRRMVGSMGPLGEFGTLFHALRIMETVWKSRASIDENDWDLASCLSVLGSSALLL